MSADASRPRPVALVIDDEEGVRESFRVIFEGEFEVLEADQGVKGLEVLRSRRVDVVLLDVRMPGPPGPTFLPQILALDDRIAVIIVTAVKDVRTAVEAIKGGAYDYVTKPFDVDEILALVRQAAERRVLEREVHYLRAELDRAQGFDALVGRHPSMVRLYELIAQVAQTPATVLIAAESGTGKELVARAIHRQGPRRAQPLVAVNLAAIPDTLLESELFGHEKGAFTGAHARKMGKFELAHGGTLFLDEVGTLRVDLQAKLLRALQEREIERLGGGRTIPVDVRIIAATNVDLKAAVRARTFREDLFYRLNVVPLTIPPLRARKDDIPILVDHFLRKYSREFKKDVRESRVLSRLQPVPPHSPREVASGLRPVAPAATSRTRGAAQRMSSSRLVQPRIGAAHSGSTSWTRRCGGAARVLDTARRRGVACDARVC